MDVFPAPYNVLRSESEFKKPCGLSAVNLASWLRVRRLAPELGYSPIQSDEKLASFFFCGLDNLMQAATRSLYPEGSALKTNRQASASSQRTSFFAKLYVLWALGILCERSFQNAVVLEQIITHFDRSNCRFNSPQIVGLCEALVLPDRKGPNDTCLRFLAAAETILSEVISNAQVNMDHAA